MSVPQPTNTQGTLGHTLKALREAQNLSLADIASRLRLDPRVIAAIEANDHQALPTALYVRGYLRGYARILRTDPEPLVSRYNEEAPSTPPDILPGISRPAQRSSDDAPVRATTIAVVLLLGVLFALWWQTTYRPIPALVPMPELAVPPTAAPALKAAVPQSQLPYSYTIVTHPASTYYRAPDVEDGAGAGLDGDGTAVTEGANTSTGSATRGPDEIVFRTTTDSWLEVTDRSGERVYMDFVHAGESLTLTGHSPFDVLLGYALGVAVEFNGQAFDPAPHTRAGVARFSLGR